VRTVKATRTTRWLALQTWEGDRVDMQMDEYDEEMDITVSVVLFRIVEALIAG